MNPGRTSNFIRDKRLGPASMAFQESWVLSLLDTVTKSNGIAKV